MFSSNSRGNYAPLGDEANGNRGSKFGSNTYMVQRYMPEGRTIFRVILGCTFALGIIALLKTTGGRVTKLFPQGYGCDYSSKYDCSQCLAGIEETKDQVVDATWKFDWRRDGEKFGLSESQCDAAFPGLWRDMELALEKRNGVNVTMEELDQAMEGEGAIRCMIYDGKLYIIDTNHVHDPKFFHRAMATLSALYRAIVAMPDPRSLPNIEFVLNIHDKTDFAYDAKAPGGGANRPVWAYTRLVKQDKVWLMPDFGFFSWPEGHIGTPSEVTMRMEEVEAGLEFQDKVEKVFWRGAVNTEPQIRGSLVNETIGKPWADVEEIHWGDPENERQFLVPITDHCRWMFLAHTEGHSYSGRLKYLQSCRSVIIAHKLFWIQPQNYMMVASGESQNFVEVERDFSNLESSVIKLIEDPVKAKKIADNQVRTFKERYLTPAAEACYWRKLVREWSRVGPSPVFKEEGGEWRGMPFETYAMMKQTAY